MRYIAWLVVAVPLGWGLMKSVQKSVPLFSSPPSEVQKSLP